MRGSPEGAQLESALRIRDIGRLADTENDGLPCADGDMGYTLDRAHGLHFLYSSLSILVVVAVELWETRYEFSKSCGQAGRSALSDLPRLSTGRHFHSPWRRGLTRTRLWPSSVANSRGPTHTFQYRSSTCSSPTSSPAKHWLR